MSSPPPDYVKPGYGQQQQQPGYPPQATYNPQQGGQVAMAPAPTMIVRQQGVAPDDYLIFSVLVTLFCCCPFGIVAIMKSLDVRSRVSTGDLAGAQHASREAKKWCIVALVTGIILEVIGIIIIIVYYVLIISLATSATNSVSSIYG